MDRAETHWILRYVCVVIVHTGTRLLWAHPALMAGEVDEEHEPTIASVGGVPHAAYLFHGVGA